MVPGRRDGGGVRTPPTSLVRVLGSAKSIAIAFEAVLN